MTPLRAYRRMACDVCHTRNVTAVRVGIDYLCKACLNSASDAIDEKNAEAAVRQEAKQIKAGAAR